MFFKRNAPANEAVFPAGAGGISTESPVRKRPLLVRLFSLKFWGAVRLTALCVLIGLIQKIGWADKKSQEVDLLPTIQAIWENTFHGLIWIVKHGWQPAMMGATIVLPIWIIWRLISLPFRR